MRMFMCLLSGMLLVGVAMPAFAGQRPGCPNPDFTIVCSDAGTGAAYEAFPDVCRTKSGELLCVFYAGYGHESVPNEQLPRGGRITMCRSSDDGKTWSPATIVVDTPADDRDPSIIELPGGDLLVVFCANIDGSQAVDSYEILLVRSTDGGKTWSKPKRIPSPFTQANAVTTPPRLMPDGRLLLPIYGNYKGQPKNFALVALLESRDMGRSWTTLAEITSRLGYPLREPDLVRLPSGELFMVMRPVMTWSRSTDGGKTWSDARMLGRGVRILKGGIAGAGKIRSAPGVLGIQGDAPYLLLTSKNILLCGIRYCPWSSTCVIYSTDFGRTWSMPIVIDRVPGAYPSMVELPDGRILFVYYTEGKEDDIRCKYLRADELGVGVIESKP